MEKTLTIDEIKARPLEELLHEVVDKQEAVRIMVEEGHAVEIRPVPALKPLTRLPGSVPTGWKDAIYEPKR